MIDVFRVEDTLIIRIHQKLQSIYYTPIILIVSMGTSLSNHTNFLSIIFLTNPPPPIIMNLIFIILIYLLA